ncbi:MAG: peptide chain release factor N(5)-glutamine methyltransferase [Paraglaciecola sp.]|uniref:peptide chain release factor N(5)-glutamine methyltransferase n=1 Tax=Paraglaciecola sp. TaxID=1920173 RepID=UPI0032635C4D
MLEPNSTVEQALKWARCKLTEHQISDDGSYDSAAIDSKVLLCGCLDCEQIYLHTWPEKQLTMEQINTFHHMLEKRILGYPVAYIVGFRHFWSLRLAVSEATLIPRPETELLVELALDLAFHDSIRVLDLGTGTGAIALALASENKQWSVIGIDKNYEAVKLATLNATNNQLPDVEFIQSDWFSSVEKQKFDLIVSNPPYIEINDHHLTQGDVRFEPSSALISGNDGLDDIRFIIANSVNYLNHKGWLLLEHGNEQAEIIANLLTLNGFLNVRTECDLNGQPRVSMGQLNGLNS